MPYNTLVNQTQHNTTMRDLVIQRLTALIEDGDGIPSYGVPRYFDCGEDEYVTNVEELTDMSDEELLEMFETVVGFLGFQGQTLDELAQ